MPTTKPCAASEVVAAVEQLELGQPFADLVRAAKKAIDELRDAAVAEIFPEHIAPIAADAYAGLAHYTGRFSRVTYAADMVRLHARCLSTHPDLARLIRTPEVRGDVGLAAEARSAPAPGERPVAAGIRVANEAMGAFDLEIARQLVAAGHDHSEAARDVVVAADLADRLIAAEARHKEAAGAALAKLEAERQAAEQAREAELARASAAAEAEAAQLEAKARQLRSGARGG